MSQQHLDRACEKGAPKFKKCDSVDLSPALKSNLDEAVKNIALQSQKSNYNPEVDMNWCNLPIEMRLECVKHLDFKTRCGFRGVSKSEKSLVDSGKYQFKHLQINFEIQVTGYGNNIWDIIAKSGNEESELHIRTKNRLNEKFLSAIFKYAEVKNFRFGALHSVCELPPILEQLKKFAPFPFKRVAVFGNPSIVFFMQHCLNLEKVDVYHQLPYKEMLKLPSLIEIKEFKLLFVSPSDLLHFLPELVQKWIDKDVEIGKLMQFNNENEGIVNMVAEKFADRIIEKTDKEVRIRMNNEKTQILMRSLGKDYAGKFSCSCKVIPIDLLKSEYDKGDGWILKRVGRDKDLTNAPEENEAEDEEIWRFF